MKFSPFIMVIGFILVPAILGTDNLVMCQNLLPNGGFEITTVPDVPDCWDQYLGAKKVPNWSSLWKIDRTESFEGKKSLLIRIPSPYFKRKVWVESCLSEYLFGRLRHSWLPKNKDYLLSLFMKSDRSGLPVEVFFQRSHQVRVSQNWRRFCFHCSMNSSDKLKKIRVKPNGCGRLWIDAVQLEEGKSPTNFSPSRFDTRFVKLPTPLTREEVNSRIRRLVLYGKGSRIAKPIEISQKGPKRVGIDHTRRCLFLRGRPFFFFAASFMRAHLYKRRWAEILDMLKDHGYSVVIVTFSCKWNDSHASTSDIIAFLNMAHDRKLMVIPWLNPNALKDKGGKYIKVKKYFSPKVVLREYKKEIRRMIPVLKDHPAILAWYLCDEPNKRLVRSGFTRDIVKYAKGIDPYHPIYINYGSMWEDYKTNNFKIPGDIVSRAVYPIPIRPITRVARTVAGECIAGNYIKPVVVWLQLWSGNGRYPTPKEFNCMAYLAAIYGATGFQTWPMVPGSKLLWESVKQVIAEMRQLTPVLYEPKKVLVDIEGSEYVHAMAKNVNGKYWVVVTNTLDRSQDLRIKLPEVSAISAVNVKFETHKCRFQSNTILDQLDAYGRRVYVVTP